MFVNNLNEEKYEITLGENICRFCLRTDKQEMENIFVQRSFTIEEVCSFAAINISKRDELPENACLNCINLIKDCLSFRSKIQESDKVLRNSGVLVAIQEIPSTTTTTNQSVNTFAKNKLKLSSKIEKQKTKDLQEVNPLQKLILDLDISEECEEIIDNKNEIDEDLKNVERFECTVCSKTFDLKSRFDQHLTIHSNLPVPCPICQKKFKNAKYMNAHLKTHSNIEEHPCDKCNKKFASKSNLKKHEKVRHTEIKKIPEKNFLCHICSQEFSTRSNLKNHLEIHEPREKPEFLCEICEKRFFTATHLKKHLNTHSTNGQVYKCEKCDKEFKQLKHLKEHIIVHSDERKFKCSVCEKKFLRNNQMKIHMKIHTNEKDIPCPICNMKFSQKGNMKRHLSMVHKNKSI